jgi:hypothetical protein
MPKFIVLGTGERATWRLPAETDLDELRSRVGRCMVEQNYAEVAVEMQDEPRYEPRDRGVLVLNGQALPFVALVERPESKGSKSWA